MSVFWPEPALGSARIANRSNAKTLNRVVGVVMILTSVVVLAVNSLK